MICNFAKQPSSFVAGGIVPSDPSGVGNSLDNQTLSISSTGLSIDGGNTISMSALIAALIAGGLSSGGGSADTDDQDLGLSATELTISEGAGVSLSDLAANLAPLLASLPALHGDLVTDAFGVPQGYLLPL